MCVSPPLAEIAKIATGLITRDYDCSTSNTQKQLLKYLSLDQKGKVMAEYIWIDAEGGVRSKTKVRVTPIIAGGPYLAISRSRVSPDKPQPTSPQQQCEAREYRLDKPKLTNDSRLSPRLSPPSMSSLSGTLTAPPLARPPATTPMSISAPLLSSLTPSARERTSLSSVRPGTLMAPPTSSTTVTRPLS